MAIFNKYRFLTIATAFFITGFTLQSCHHTDEGQEKDTRFEVTDSLLKSVIVDTVKEAGALSQITLTGSLGGASTQFAQMFANGNTFWMSGTLRVNSWPAVRRRWTSSEERNSARLR